MVVKKYFVNNPREGYQLDRKRNQYFSWGFDIWLNRSRVSERGFKTKDAAEAIASRLKQEAKFARHGMAMPSESPQLIELFQKKLDSITDNRRERTRNKRIFKRFLSVVPTGIKVIEIRQAHLQNFITSRLSDVNASTGGQISPVTVRRELTPIVATLNAAGKFFADLDDYKPPRVPQLKIPRGRKERVITHEEQNAIFANLFAPRADGEDRRRFEARVRTGQFFQFCLLTVSRPGEVAALKWADVDLDGGIVVIIGTKTRFVSDQIIRRLKITPTMKRILEARHEISGGETFVFTTGGVVTPRMYKEMKRACEDAGISYGRSDRNAISFHTARHTGVTRLLRKGSDLKTVGQISGHSDSSMIMYYSHTNPELRDAAMDILESEIT